MASAASWWGLGETSIFDNGTPPNSFDDTQLNDTQLESSQEDAPTMPAADDFKNESPLQLTSKMDPPPEPTPEPTARADEPDAKRFKPTPEPTQPGPTPEPTPEPTTKSPFPWHIPDHLRNRPVGESSRVPPVGEGDRQYLVSNASTFSKPDDQRVKIIAKVIEIDDESD